MWQIACLHIEGEEPIKLGSLFQIICRQFGLHGNATYKLILNFRQAAKETLANSKSSFQYVQGKIKYLFIAHIVACVMPEWNSKNVAWVISGMSDYWQTVTKQGENAHKKRINNIVFKTNNTCVMV